MKYKLMSAALFAAFSAQAETEVMNALPEDTVAAMQLDLRDETTKALRENTKLGAKMFSDEQMAKYTSLLRELMASDGSDKKFDEFLGKNNMSQDEFFKMFKSRMGMAVNVKTTAINATRNEDLLLITLWLDAPKESSAKLMQAILQAAAEEKDKKILRTDLQLDGSQASLLETEGEAGAILLGLSPEGRLLVMLCMEDKSTEPDFDAEEEMEEEMEEDPFAQEEDPFAQSAQGQDAAIKPVQAIDEDMEDNGDFDMPEEFKPLTEEELKKLQAARVDYLKTSFGQLSQNMAGAGTAFVRNMHAKAGVAAAKPAGTPMMEAYLNMDAVKTLKPKEFAEMALQGFKDMPAGALWLSFDPTSSSLRMRGFANIPSSLREKIKGLEMPVLPLMPPAWVSADVKSYTQMSIDIPQIWSWVKTLGDNAEQMAQVEQMMEGQLQQMLQTDFNTLINAFGKSIYMVEGEDLPSTDGKTPAKQMTVAWDFSQPELFGRIMAMAKGQMGMMLGPDVMREADMQGFKGLSITPTPGEASHHVLHGDGTIIYTTGTQAFTDGMLADIKSNGKDVNTLIKSEAFRSFLKRYGIEPGLFFSWTNGEMAAKDAEEAFKMAETSLAEASMDAKKQELFKKLLALIPRGEEMKGMLGNSAASARFTADGFLLESVSEMPAK